LGHGKTLGQQQGYAEALKSWSEKTVTSLYDESMDPKTLKSRITEFIDTYNNIVDKGRIKIKPLISAEDFFKNIDENAPDAAQKMVEKLRAAVQNA